MKFRKKQLIVDAIRFDGENLKECLDYIGIENVDNTLSHPNIITSEGVMSVSPGDWIIKEPFDKERKFYPCKPDIFEQTYEVV